MHIPDGFLSTPVWAALDVATVPAVGYMARRASLHLEESRVPLLGVLGAFVFAAQMVNFPVGMGTSGHLMGGALLAYTLGPAAASLVMTAILTIQAFLFQDGGVLALGANVMSMAVVGVVAAYLPYRLWGAGPARSFAIFAGGALSVLVTAGSAMTFLYVSGVPMPAALLGIPVALFVVAAMVEGAITLAVIRAIERLHPDWVRQPGATGTGPIPWIAGAAVVLAGVGFLFASTQPDGFEHLSERLGIAAQATALVQTPLADYEAAFLRTGWLRRFVAGIAGLGIVWLACVGAGRLLATRRSS